MNFLIIAAGGLVGVLASLGLVVCWRVAVMAISLRRALRTPRAAKDAAQAALNRAQQQVCERQRELARRKV